MDDAHDVSACNERAAASGLGDSRAVTPVSYGYDRWGWTEFKPVGESSRVCVSVCHVLPSFSPPTTPLHYSRRCRRHGRHVGTVK